MRPWKDSFVCSLQVCGNKEPLHRVLHGGWEGKELGSHLFSFIHSLIHLTNTVFIKGHLSESWGYGWEYRWEQARHHSCPHEAFNPTREPSIKPVITGLQPQYPTPGPTTRQTEIPCEAGADSAVLLSVLGSPCAASPPLSSLVSCSPDITGRLSIRVPIAGEIESRGSFYRVCSLFS